jgi:D-tyrosyl-tRNA(Tyr) deacylase
MHGWGADSVYVCCQAAPVWDTFVARVGSEYITDRVKDGRFGAFMNVSLVNDGPVTVSLDSSR